MLVTLNHYSNHRETGSKVPLLLEKKDFIIHVIDRIFREIRVPQEKLSESSDYMDNFYIIIV